MAKPTKKIEPELMDLRLAVPEDILEQLEEAAKRCDPPLTRNQYILVTLRRAAGEKPLMMTKEVA